MAEKISRKNNIKWVQTINSDNNIEFFPLPPLYASKGDPNSSLNLINIQGALVKSASYATTASFFSGTVISASYALTASFSQNAQTASFFSGSISNAINAISASYALTASFFSGSISNAINAISASYALTASFFSGSISNAISASYALTASFAMNSGVASTPFRISTGSISASVNIGSTIFLITNNNIPVLTVSQSGIVTLATQSIDPTGTAPNGAIYFTSSSFFIGLD